MYICHAHTHILTCTHKHKITLTLTHVVCGLTRLRSLRRKLQDDETKKKPIHICVHTQMYARTYVSRTHTHILTHTHTHTNTHNPTHTHSFSVS